MQETAWVANKAKGVNVKKKMMPGINVHKSVQLDAQVNFDRFPKLGPSHAFKHSPLKTLTAKSPAKDLMHDLPQIESTSIKPHLANRNKNNWQK